MVEATISAANVASLAADLISLGVRKESIETVLGFPLTELDNPEDPIPVSNYVRLEQEAARLTEDETIGLVLGSIFSFSGSKTGVVGYLARNSSTLGMAFKQAIRFSNLISDVFHIALRTEGDNAEFIYSRPIPETFTIMGIELTLARTVVTLKAVVGDDFYLKKAAFQYPQPSYLEKYQQVFGLRVDFEQPENLVCFPVEYLQQEIPGSQDYLHEILDQRANEQLARFEKAKGTTYEVRKSILDHLPTGDANVEIVAKQLHISRQTLFRKLKAEGTSFQEILDDIRKSLASNYLRDDKYSVMETAFLLGFSEPSTFHRAFKRWYGQTPLEFCVEGNS
jgi:AraC-like DNA-binding protein